MATLRRHTSSSSDCDPPLPRTPILHLNVRPNEGVKWSTIQVQKSTIYLQFALQLNRRLRGRDAHFWSTIYLQSTPVATAAARAGGRSGFFARPDSLGADAHQRSGDSRSDRSIERRACTGYQTNRISPMLDQTESWASRSVLAAGQKIIGSCCQYRFSGEV